MVRKKIDPKRNERPSYPDDPELQALVERFMNNELLIKKKVKKKKPPLNKSDGVLMAGSARQGQLRPKRSFR